MNNRTNKTTDSAMTEIARRIADIQNLWTVDDRNARAEEGATRREQLLEMLGAAQPTAVTAAA